MRCLLRRRNFNLHRLQASTRQQQKSEEVRNELMKLNIGWMNTGTDGSPDIVSRVPPFGEPLVGDTPVTAGSDWKYFIDDATSITASPLKINKTYGRNLDTRAMEYIVYMEWTRL